MLKIHSFCEKKKKNLPGDLTQRRGGKPKATWDICDLPEFFKTFEASLESSVAQFTKKDFVRKLMEVEKISIKFGS